MYQIDNEISDINFKLSQLQQDAHDVARSRINSYRQGNRNKRNKPEPIYFNQSVNLG